ncbi:MAG: PKD domain-containing protein [Flavobacteriales bacterium]|nr:PKD domain-containing protein [Flavobacteriales bacterium]
MKKTLLALILICFSLNYFSQTLSWSGFPNGGTSYTTGIMTATITSSNPGFQNGTPKFIAGTSNGGGYCSLANSLELEHLFSNITNAHSTLTLDFTSGGTTSGLCGSITFKIKDINSDESYQTFADWVEVNAIDGNNAAIAVTNITATGGTNKTIIASGNTRIVKGYSNNAYGSRSTTNCDDVTFTITAPASGTLKSVTIKYHPDYTVCNNCYYNFTGPNRPAYQYISIGPVTVTNSATTPTISASGPTTFCSGGSVTLTSSSATGNTWSTGATTQSIVVTTAGNYTVSVNSGGCIGTSAATVVTVNNPNSISNKTATICSGGTYNFTASAGDVVPVGTTYSWNFINNIAISGATNGVNLTGISQTLTNNSSLPQTIVYTVTPTSNGCNGTPFNITLTVNAPLNGGTISANQSICPNTTPSILNNVTFASGGSGLGLVNSIQIGNQIWMNTNLDVLNYTDGQLIGTDFTQAVGAYTWYNNDQPTYGVYAPLYNWFAVNTNKLCPNGWKVPTNNDWLILMNFLASNQGNKLKSCRQVNSPLGGNCNVSALPRWDSHNSQFGTNDVGFSALPAGRKEISNFLYTGSRASFWSADNYTPGINGSSYYVNLAVNLATAEYSDFIDYYTSSRWGLSVRCLANNTTNVNTSYTYQWQVDPGCTGNWTNISGANAVNYQPGVLSQTTCYRRLTIDVQCGTVNSNTVTISMIPTVTPTITASGSTTICQGGNVTLTSSAGDSYLWSTGATTQSIIVTTAGNYTVSVSSGGCTSTSAATTVTVNNPPATPTISASGPTTFCQGGSVTLTSSASSGNTWSTGATTQSITVSASGTYSVTVGSAGCTATSASTTVTVNPNPPTPTISASGALTFCAGGSVILTSSTATGNTWSTGATNNSIDVTSSGTYTVSVSSGGCTSTSAATVVTVNASPTTPTISANGPTTFCQGGSVTLTSSAASGNTWSTGATTQSIPVSASGTYSVTVGSAGCTATSASTIVTVNPNPPTPTISASGALTFCGGGSVTLTSSSATGNTWSTGATTQSIDVTSSGTYTVSVSSGGCTSTSAATVVTVNASPTAPTISASGPTTFCQGGSVTLTSSAASGNTWSTGATTQSITVSASGTYTLTYIDVNGCTSGVASIVVSVSSNPLTPTITANGPTTFCLGASVTLTSSETSGNTWSTGETTQSIIVNSAGNYSVSVGASGCSATSSTINIAVNSLPSTPNITASQLNLCAGQTATLTSSSPNGNTWSTGENTASITVSAAGTYTVFTTDANGCNSATGSVTISATTQPNAPTITASGPTTICQGSSVTLTSSEISGNVWSTGETSQSIIVTTSGTYSLTYSINGCTSAPASQIVTVTSNPSTPTVTPSDPVAFCVGGSVTLTSSATSGNTWSTGETTQSIVVNSSGSYTVTVGASGCSATSAAVIVTTNPIPPTPTITASQTSICSPQSATLTSSVSSGNTWSTGATSNSISVSSSGTYTLTTTDANGCVSQSANITINANPQPTAPTITANGPTNFCQGGSVTLSSSSPTGNTWSTGATTQTIVVTTSGTYTLTYLDANGCTSAIASQTVTVNSNPPTPTITASGPTTFCTSGSVTLSSSATSGNTWSTGANTQNITVTTPGTYSVTVGAAGCSATSNTITITVNQNPTTPTITASQLSLCNGQTATLTSNSITGNTWSTGETTQSITVSSPGTYTVYTTVNGCNSANASVTVTAGTVPTVNVNSVSICLGQTATLTATPSTAGGTFLWSPGGSTNSTINVTPNSTTSYSVVYTLNGCASAAGSGTVTISSGNTVSFSADNLTGCAPLTVNFSNLTPGSPTNCLWTLGNGVTLNGCNATYTFTTPGCYDVTLSNSVGGCAGSQTSNDYICVTASPNASFSMNPSVFSTSPQTINFINNSSNATSYEWNFGDGSTSDLLSPSHIYNNTEIGYTVTLTATNAAGCTDVHSVSIGSTDGLVYYIPNTFTPDGDGFNQTFQPVFTSGFDPYNFQMLIYNRWGELIFESYDASKGWDGSYGTEGGLVEDGTYTYKITFKNPKLDERVIIHGHVNMIR